jgi:alpha-galactosidase
MQPGLWLAPFLAAPDSRVALDHPDWVARRPDGRGLYAWANPAWGGLMYALDTTNDEVAAHLEELARTVVELGFTYLKLDFTFAPSVDGVWADRSKTPAERVRAGYAAIRRGAGDDTFILGCGVPLSHVVGLVDANRIGPDVAPVWSLDPSAELVPGYLGTQPATQHAYVNTVTRSFMHRRLWLNDPDCVMLRTADTRLTAEAARTWLDAVALSGGMMLVSDDLALLDRRARAMLDDAIAIGRESDESPAVAADLMDAATPTTFVGAGRRLVTEPGTGRSVMTTDP